MSEFVFGYMLFFKKRIFERIQSQQAKKWDDFEAASCAARRSVCWEWAPLGHTWQGRQNTSG